MTDFNSIDLIIYAWGFDRNCTDNIKFMWITDGKCEWYRIFEDDRGF